MNNQIKSKKRVTDHGEVFTNEREVNAMLDMVKHETERIESRFLEPACGNGNFLAEILNRKLLIVEKNYSKNPADFERKSIESLMSIYGVDLLQDNIDECIERLFSIWNKQYTKHCKKECTDHIRSIAKYILRKNILCGDALTLKQNDGTPIIFAEWSFVMGDMVQRRDYRLDELLEGQGKKKGDQEQLSLFDESPKGWVYDEETDAYIPDAIKSFPLTSYRRLNEYE